MKKILISIFLFISLINANDISTLISSIKNAPASQKRTLINQLKLKLRNANSTQRADAINKLRSTPHQRNTTHSMKQNNSLHNKNINNQIHINNNNLNQIKQQKGKGSNNH